MNEYERREFEKQKQLAEKQFRELYNPKIPEGREPRPLSGSSFESGEGEGYAPMSERYGHSGEPSRGQRSREYGAPGGFSGGFDRDGGFDRGGHNKDGAGHGSGRTPPHDGRGMQHNDGRSIGPSSDQDDAHRRRDKDEHMLSGCGPSSGCQNGPGRNTGFDLLRLFNFKNMELDNDRVIILALALLLSSEQTDEILLLALLYIML